MPGVFLANLFSISYLYCEVDVPEAVDLPVAFSGEDTLIVFLNREKQSLPGGLEPGTVHGGTNLGSAAAQGRQKSTIAGSCVERPAAKR